MSVIYDLDNEYGGRIIGDGGEDSGGVLQVKSAATAIPALTVSRTANGSPTIAPFRVLGVSAASTAVMGFAGGFISVTSVNFTGLISFDRVLPVEVGGLVRGIPLMSLATIGAGEAAF